MAEYIERDKALNVCEMHYQHCISMQDWRGDTIAWNIGADIKTIPAADVIEVKHGKWELVKNKVICSYCKKAAFSVSQICYKNDKKIIKKSFIHTPYCPHCGADMRGADNENRFD